MLESILSAIYILLLKIYPKAMPSIVAAASTSSNTGAQPKEKKKIILIIGISAGGAYLMDNLLGSSAFPHDTYKIIGVDMRSVAFWSIASLRAAIVPGWEENIILPFDGILTKSKGKGDHEILSGWKVIDISWEEKTATLAPVISSEKEKTHEMIISWEHLVLATGASYRFPCQPNSSPDFSLTKDGILSDLKAYQATVRGAQRVIIVGAGPVGIEFAGEIKETYPEKEVAVLSSSPTLLPKKSDPKYHPALGKALDKGLREMGVKILYSTRSASIAEDGKSLVTNTGETLTADLIIPAYGLTPRSDLLKTSGKSEAIDDKGRVKVDPFLRIEGLGDSNVWAIGDVNNVPELKLARWAAQQAVVTSKNILQLITKGQGHGPLKEYSPSFMAQTISLGKEKGYGQMGAILLTGWLGCKLIVATFCKNLGLPNFKAMYGAS